MSDQSPQPSSPNWSATTKSIVGFTLFVLLLAAVFYFRQIIAPLLLALILTYLLHPLVARLCQWLKLSWRASVNLVYIFLLIILGAVFTLAGFAIVQQIQSLVSFLQRFVSGLPDLVTELSSQVYSFGPFQFDLSQYDLASLADQVLGVIQPLLGQAGGIASKLATSAVSTFGWGLFILLISYFLLSESGQLRENIVKVDIPGYGEDIRRLGGELSKIWDAFLRGQMVISLLVVIAYSLLLTILGTRLTLAIALMAGAARFIPWIGPMATWSVTAIVAFLQTGNYFGLQPLHYTLLVVAACLLLDQIFDNLIIPRLLGETLGVHPAGVLITALIAAQIIGFIGLVIAAPALATLNLMGRYIMRKMFDLDPWPEPESSTEHKEYPWRAFLQAILARLKRLLPAKKTKKSG